MTRQSVAEATEWPQPNSARGAPWAIASQISWPGLVLALQESHHVAGDLAGVLVLDAAAQAGGQSRSLQFGGSGRVTVTRTLPAGVTSTGGSARPPPLAHTLRRSPGTSSCAKRT